MQTTDYFEKGKELGKFCVQTGISTSQLRNVLSLVNVLTNKVKNNEEKWDKIVEELDYLKVKLAYQAGRDKNDNFIKINDNFFIINKDENNRYYIVKDTKKYYIQTKEKGEPLHLEIEGNIYNKQTFKPLVEFYNKIEPEINKVKQNKDNYENFAKLIETIVAFHKYEGGKD